MGWDGYFFENGTCARKRTETLYRLQKYTPDKTDGVWDIPKLEAVTLERLPEKWIGFNQALSFRGDKNGVGVHFFIDDYQFERIWNAPGRYTDALRGFDCVMTPDWSMYFDFPRALCLWNLFRKNLIGKAWQDEKMVVIPTVRWGVPDTWGFCFSGMPEGGTVAVSTIHADPPANKSAWRLGFAEMVRQVKPAKVLMYGTPIDVDADGVEIVNVQNAPLGRLRLVNPNGGRITPRTAWIIQHPERIKSVGRRLGIHEAELDDFLQDVTIKSMERRDDFDHEKGKLAGWALTFAHYEGLGYRRKMQRREKPRPEEWLDVVCSGK